MALKKWMKKLQPLRLYIVLTLTTFYFLVQLVACYITHALTLTVDSYLVLCNIISLSGYVITLKENDADDSPQSECSVNSHSQNSSKSEVNRAIECKNEFVRLSNSENQKVSEHKLRNTFGWARVDVLIMCVCCIVFVSLCFSIVIESIQTFLHISHLDTMHYPMPVFVVGLAGLILNGLSYLLIGGYAVHRGSFLLTSTSGIVIMDEVFIQNGQRNFSLKPNIQVNRNKFLGVLELYRDAIGNILVMACSSIVYYMYDDVNSKYVDPFFAIFSSICLVTMSIPYIKESCLILLQTIPGHINVDLLCKQLMDEFPGIVNVHDLHIWQFTRERTFLTVHIIFLNPQVYITIGNNIKNLLISKGISQVTIQPEFYDDINCIEFISSLKSSCLVKCQSVDCYDRQCCGSESSNELNTATIQHKHEKGKSSEKKKNNEKMSSNIEIPETHSSCKNVVQVLNSPSLENNVQVTSNETHTDCL